MNYYPLSVANCDLGESIYLDEETSLLYWLDINHSVIYSYCILEDKLISSFSVGCSPSSILQVCSKSLLYIDSFGLKTLDLQTGEVNLFAKHINHDPGSFRANDGVKLSTGELIYGTMSYDTQSPGKLYTYYKNCLNYNDCQIYIPNSFIEVDEGVLISDSKSKVTYIYDKEHQKLKLWKSFEHELGTPDGGFLSRKGYVHICFWDGSTVVVLDKKGNEKTRISVPVQRPTSCIIYSDRWLFVTSAIDGMNKKELKDSPLSGKTIKIDLGDNYEY